MSASPTHDERPRIAAVRQHQSGATILVGRRRELQELKRFAEDVRSGQSASLRVHGEAGVGKTALIDYLVDRCAGLTLLRAAGAQAETELAFATLYQVCAPLLHYSPQLAPVHNSSLLVALGVRQGPQPERLTLGLAVLNLLTEAAREKPLLCVIDDAQWMDSASAQVLGFVARRIRAESVGMVFAERTDTDLGTGPSLSGVPDLHVRGLEDADARTLLLLANPVQPDERFLQRIIAESGGNPLALLELPRGFAASELTGGFGQQELASLPQKIEESYRRQLQSLSEPTRRLLLVAASEPTGDPVLVWRAVEALGLQTAVNQDAVHEAGSMVQFSPRVYFRHPLLRSAVYRAASDDDRAEVHQALAEVTDRGEDPDRRTWHLAQAARDFDDGVAAELASSAERAWSRGAPAAAAAFFERSAELTSDPAVRTGRLLSSAEFKLLAGLPDDAVAVLARTDSTHLTPREQAHADLLRARLRFVTSRTGDAPLMLLKAAERLRQLDPANAAEIYYEALHAGWHSGPAMTGITYPELVSAAVDATASLGVDANMMLLLRGLAARYNDDYIAGTAMTNAGAEAIPAELSDAGGASRRPWLGAVGAFDIWRDDLADDLTEALLQQARRSGALAILPTALTFRSVIRTVLGDLTGAEELLDQLKAAQGSLFGVFEFAYGDLLLNAWRGRPESVAAQASAISADALRKGEGSALIAVAWIEALCANGQGRYAAAAAAARRALAPAADRGSLKWNALSELVVAASRSGDQHGASAALAELRVMAEASGTSWARGILARSEALVQEEGGDPEALYRSSIELLTDTRARGDLGRAYLYYGQWLLQSDRREDARRYLRVAFTSFDEMGAEGFAGLAAAALAAVGESVGRQAPADGPQLTKHEAQIVRMVRAGLSNAEIAGRLFVSPRTVEWHLSKVFAKLEVKSRKDLQQ